MSAKSDYLENALLTVLGNVRNNTTGNPPGWWVDYSDDTGGHGRNQFQYDPPDVPPPPVYIYRPVVSPIMTPCKYCGSGMLESDRNCEMCGGPRE